MPGAGAPFAPPLHATACTGNEISRFEIVESDKAGAFDEACEDANSKFVGTTDLPNDSTTWPVFMSRNVRNYLTQTKRRTTYSHITREIFHRETRVMGHGFQRSIAKVYSQMVKR